MVTPAVDFIKIKTKEARIRIGRWSNKYPIFRSIPTDTKKKLINMSLKGTMFPIACWLYWEPEMTIPAKNAPRARDSPILEVKSAVERQMKTTLTRNNSFYYLSYPHGRISRESGIWHSR